MDAAKERGRRGRGLLPTLLVTVVLALLFRSFVMQAFWIPSGSMESTLEIGDRVAVEKLSVHDGVAPGEVVVFDGAGSFDGPDEHLDYIKRVIAVGGQSVQCCDAQGRVSVDGSALEEPYLFEDDRLPFGPVTVPDGEIWVMGDHRGDSSDSRYHGPVPVSSVKGRAVAVFWPFEHLKGL